MARTFIECDNASGGIIAPCVVHFDAFDSNGNVENKEIRSLIDHELKDFDEKSISTGYIETVAGTIFPETIWKMSKGDRNVFYQKYEKMWPRIKKCQANHNGVYFRRLTSFGNSSPGFNQLEHVLNTWNERNNHRHSALQVCIFDPTNDHNHQKQLGFPCLQHIIFHFNGNNGRGGLSVVALYANQLLREKAYGNYLGLHRLGCYMAKEMGIQLKDVYCIATNLKRSNNTKTACAPLVNSLKKVIGKSEKN